MMKKYIYLFLLFISFVGCSYKLHSTKFVSFDTSVTPHNTKQRLLIQRFIEYWDARAKDNIQKAWKYELPYQRYLTSFSRYSQDAFGYKGTKIVLSKIEYMDNDKAIITRKVILPNNKILNKKDKWFFVNGTWYHKFYSSVLPPKNIEEAQFQ